MDDVDEKMSDLCCSLDGHIGSQTVTYLHASITKCVACVCTVIDTVEFKHIVEVLGIILATLVVVTQETMLHILAPLVVIQEERLDLAPLEVVQEQQ